MSELNNKLSREEILSLLEKNQIDIRELAKEAKNVKNRVASEPKIGTKPTFEVVLNDHCDFAVKKTTGKNWKMLVAMASQGTLFIKDKNGSVTATKDSLTGFLKGCCHLHIPNSWIRHLEQGAVFARSLMQVFEEPIVLEALRQGVYPEFVVNEQVCSNTYSLWRKAWGEHQVLLKDFKDDAKAKALIIGSPTFITYLKNEYGIDNARDFLRSYSLSLIHKPTRVSWGTQIADSYQNVINGCFVERGDNTFKSICNFEYNAFKDYVLYDAYRMGYGDNWHNFFTEWFDCLKIQQQVYGKIKVKYPEYLQTMHDMMAYKRKKVQEAIDIENFKKQSLIAQKYEMNVGIYTFIAPREHQDFLDEAEMQQNCLASYVSKFADGQDIIMFMRYKDEPERSLVTIELVNGKLTQAYQARNRSCTDEQKEAIDTWLRRIEDR